MISDDCKYYGGRCWSVFSFFEQSRIEGRERARLIREEGYRRILSRSSHLPARIPTSTAQDDVPDTHLSPKWYVLSPHKKGSC